MPWRIAGFEFPAPTAPWRRAPRSAYPWSRFELSSPASPAACPHDSAAGYDAAWNAACAPLALPPPPVEPRANWSGARQRLIDSWQGRGRSPCAALVTTAVRIRVVLGVPLKENTARALSRACVQSHLSTHSSVLRLVHRDGWNSLSHHQFRGPTFSFNPLSRTSVSTLRLRIRFRFACWTSTRPLRAVRISSRMGLRL